ncbi:MAG: hypothetical protein WC091_14910, partial [Sulfuricellaceae bacterium]
MILETSVDRLPIQHVQSRTITKIIVTAFILETSVERAGLHGFPGAWRRCNYKRRQWNDHCASLRLLCPSRRLSG